MSKHKILKIKRETHDVKSFTLEKNRASFVAGQYCIVSISKEKRPFTYSSSPLAKHIKLTIKKVGKITSLIHQLKQGDSLIIKGPFGEALNFDEKIKEDIVLIAGGSGITPFKSIIDYAHDKKLKNKITLLYSNRTQKDIIFKKELDSAKHIKVVHTLTKEKWKQETGRIGKDMILRHIREPLQKLYYVCGPPQMNEAVKTALKEIGIANSRIRIEGWQLPGKNDSKSCFS